MHIVKTRITHNSQKQTNKKIKKGTKRCLAWQLDEERGATRYKTNVNMQKIGIPEGQKKTLHYYRQVDVINETVRLILLHNENVETVYAQL